MQELVKADLPFVRDTVPLEEAVAYFKKVAKMIKYAC